MRTHRTRPRLRALPARLSGPLLLLAGLFAATHAAAQQSPDRERGVAVIYPDSIRVGEGFQLGLTATSADRLRFPGVLPLPMELEQTGPPRIESDSAGVWKAVYPLVAWKSGRLQLPILRVPVIGGREERWVEIRAPVVEVVSVLPAESEQPRLQPPRVPAERWKIPWPWLIALLLAALLARELLSGRRPVPVPVPAGPEETPDPLDEARSALLQLRAEVVAGRLAPAALYDGVESVVRTFLVRTRGWPEEAPVRRALPDGRGASGRAGGGPADRPADIDDFWDLERVIRRALPARFGALKVSDETLLADIDTVIVWFESRAAA